MIARAAWFALALVVAGTAVNAQDVPPSATPSPAANGFSGRAHMTVSVPIQGSTIAASARVAVAQRDLLTRVDLLSVDAATLPIQIPPLTFVIDRRANTITSWNDAAHVYFTQSFLPPSLGGAARPTAAPGVSSRSSRPERSVFADLDLLTFDMRLTGHTTTAGIPTTGLAFDAKARKHGTSPITHVNGTLQLADDSAFFPAALQAQIYGNGLTTPAHFVYTVDAFDRQPAPPESFVVPDGYREATSLLGVFSGIARRNPTPVPVPSG